MLNFIYYFAKSIPYTPLTSCVCRLYSNIVIVEEFVNMCFFTVRYRRFRMQGTIANHLIGLAVTLAYYTVGIKLSILYFQ